MNNMLDDRLQTIYDLVDKKYVVDVGTDHGKLAIQLLRDNKINQATLTDISKFSLSKAENLAKLNKITNCEFLVGDGLTVLKGDYKDYLCVIAGMGGGQIIKILSSPLRQDSISDFILQPQKNTIQLREWLVNNNYKIVVDKMTKQDKIYYNVLRVCKGSDKLTQQELLFGRTNLTNPTDIFVEYLNVEKQKFELIVNNPQCKDLKAKEYYEQVCEVIKNLERR